MKDNITIRNIGIDIFDQCEENGVSVAKLEKNDFVDIPSPYKQGDFFA